MSEYHIHIDDPLTPCDLEHRPPDCTWIPAGGRPPFEPTHAFNVNIESVLRKKNDLGLSDWDVRVAVQDGLLPDHYAGIDYRDTERIAQIKLDRQVAEAGNLNFIARCVAHELMHLAVHSYEDIANRAVANVPEPLRTTLAELLEDELEQMVESLAGLLVKAPRLVPLTDEERKDWPSW